MGVPSQSQSQVQEDVWIPTSCGQCYCMCGIKARRRDGIITEIEGNPDAPTGRGSICVKGLAAPHLLYDPYRVNYPLKRPDECCRAVSKSISCAANGRAGFPTGLTELSSAGAAWILKNRGVKLSFCDLNKH